MKYICFGLEYSRVSGRACIFCNVGFDGMKLQCSAQAVNDRQLLFCMQVMKLITSANEAYKPSIGEITSQEHILFVMAKRSMTVNGSKSLWFNQHMYADS